MSSKFRERPTSLAIPPQRIEVTTAAANLALSLDDAKDFARIGGDDDDNTIRRLINSSIDRLESLTGRRFVNTTLTAYFDGFPSSDEDHLSLRVLPVSSVSSVKYYASDDGTLTTWSASKWSADTKSNNVPARVSPTFVESWPAFRDIDNAVEVEFIAGYGANDTSVPDNIKFALALMVAHDYTHRDFSTSESKRLQSLIDQIRWDAS